MDVYDLTRWRPVRIDQFAEELGTAACTLDVPTNLTTSIELLPTGRVRLVTNARCVVTEGTNEREPEVRDEPYLMHLYSPEKGDSFFFMRSDVVLWMP